MTERLLLSAPENVDLSLIPLTEYGLRHGLLTEDDLRRLRAESLPLLRCQAERLTGGRSSSLPAETAEALLDSVFYTVSLALKRCASPEEALTLLRQQPLDTLFAAGQKRLTRKVQAARLMHDELTRSLFSTPNAFYRTTLVDGIAGFFKLYRPALFAQETHITADYPLFLPLQNQTGIEFIERYLQNALCENGFLRCFPAEAVHELICAHHGRLCPHPDEPAGAVADRSTALCAGRSSCELPLLCARCGRTIAPRPFRPRSRRTFCRRAARALPRDPLSAALSILFTPLPAGACGCAHTKPSIGKARTVIGSGLRFTAYSAKYSASISAHRA